MEGWTLTTGKRSTITIIITCLANLVACSLKCFHQDVKGVETEYKFSKTVTTAQTQTQTTKTTTTSTEASIIKDIIKFIASSVNNFPTTLWSVSSRAAVLIVCPEYALAKAIQDFAVVRTVLCYVEPRKKEEEDGSKDDVFWVARRALFCVDGMYAQMRGFVRRVGDGTVPVSIYEYAIYAHHLRNSPLPGPKFTLPTIPTNSDTLSSLTTNIQSIYSIVTALARTATKLAVSPLELATLSYILTALFMYIFWTTKPFGISQPTVLEGLTKDLHNELFPGNPHPAMPPSLQTAVNRINGESIKARLKTIRILKLAHIHVWLAACLPLMHLQPTLHHTFYLAIFQTVLIGTAAIYIAGWNFAFETTAASTAWRVLSIMLMAIPVFVVAFQVPIVVWRRFITKKDAELNGLLLWVMVGLAAIYTGARLALLGVALYALKSLPESVYDEIDWTEFIPSLS